MQTKTYLQLTGLIFGVVTLAHLLRSLTGWPVVLGDWTVPMWASWIGLVVGGYLSWTAFKLAK